MARDGKNVVNLDALIPRADLFEQSVPGKLDQNIRISDLEPGVTYNLLRKPDFQRETANWNPQQVAGLIQTFSDSDIIPAIILWENGTSLFVVDGAHRLSALIGWVQSDFGAGTLSQLMFGTKIPDHQRVMHDQTIELVRNAVGLWPDYKERKGISSLRTLPVQWIEGRTAPQAARAFIRINQGGTEIDALETRILQAGGSALAVATRAIARGGAGHRYWDHFSNEEARRRSPALGEEIYKLLYEPKLEPPLKTVEVPLAGIGYGVAVLRLAFDLVALANQLPVADSTRKAKATDPELEKDPTGTQTLAYLRRTKRIVQMILSNERHSLGLHPALYCYTSNGNFQPAALLNIVAWVMRLDATGRLETFRRVRGDFEDLILAHPAMVKPAVNKLGTGTRNRPRALSLLDRAVDLLAAGKSKEEAWETLIEEFPQIAVAEPEPEEGEGAGRPFSSGAKSALSLSDLGAAPRCPLCQGLLHPNGKTADHRDKRADGGSSHSRNGRWVHPACNGARDKDEAKGGGQR
ncbi:DUF262 domain-containing protein [Phenylobacterium sp.]|uniref:GmrSD restriction endonuclease domain-containing protein n=1 Tax=Phenylobacterium sp. TaxID=1871053 RepID=UPI002718C13B|nr:DUF262 domain-containing protein [Phenylobacterium sp.]MDO8377401.1 hypothetical protein [Phenylobacterium sp.]